MEVLDFRSMQKKDLTGLNFGIVVCRFNEYAGKGLLKACKERLKQRGVGEESIFELSVPGALEAPYRAAFLARAFPVDAVIAFGAVVRGETYHFEVVSNESARGLMNVQLESEVPVINGILTVENDEQAVERLDMKGRDCADTAIEMALLKVVEDTRIDLEETSEGHTRCISGIKGC